MDDPLTAKSKAFAVRVARMSQYLVGEKKNTSFTSKYCAPEPASAQTSKKRDGRIRKKEYAAKMAIALKEASETDY